MQLTEKVSRALKEQFPKYDILVQLDPHGRNIAILKGEVDTWGDLVDIGHAAAAVDGVRNIVSDMSVKGLEIPQKDYSGIVAQGKAAGVVDEADVVVIGLGITGCGIIRELSKYDLKVIAVDMAEDVATAASKANNGGVHMAGNTKPGTLKAKMSVRGNKLYDKWAEELGFALQRTGALVFSEDMDKFDHMESLFKTAVQNNDVRPAIMDGEQILEKAPGIKSIYGIDPVVGTWMPSQAKVHTYEVCVALAENAVENGVKIMFDCMVGEIVTEGNHVKAVVTAKGIINTKYVIDAAGIYADDIAEMAGDRCFTLHNRRGTIAIIDKSIPPASEHMIVWHNPDSHAKKNSDSKGGNTDLTPSGNILIGPSATEVYDKEDVRTTPEDFEFAMGRNDNPNVTNADIIKIFAGARPADFKEDFVIEMSEVTGGFIIAGAIQSPGVGASPAIAERVEQILARDMEARGNPLRCDPCYNPIRKKKTEFASLTHEQQAELIEQNPAYGRVVCRCETITEGEILDAIHSPVVPTSIDAIKRRTRAGMGRCQGGFCQPRVLEILARELGKKWVDINLKGEGTNILKQENR